MSRLHPVHSQAISLAFLLAISFLIPNWLVADVPLILPRPDKTPPSKGKVKVFVLAGQSNMVGFGYLQGSRPVYPSIYLSADPNIKVGRMPAGDSALLKHGVFQTSEPDSPSGANVTVYRGAYDSKKDLRKLQPLKETTVPLGDVTAQLPLVEQPHTIVANAFIEVPLDGTYELHCGFEESSHAIVSLEGKEVYRKLTDQAPIIKTIALRRGNRYPIEITYLQGGSTAFWLKQVNLQGRGDLKSLIEAGKYPWFADEDGNWSIRNDVTYWETRISKTEGGSGGPLSTTSNGKFIGPEVPFGYVMGTYHDEPVLLIESSMGNRSLSFDFRPPSSGKTKEEQENQYCGLEYKLLVEGVRGTLEKIDQIVPDYEGQGYEIAGLVWFQGHKDKDVPQSVYEKHLVNLIQDLRRDFKAPEMKTVVATVGFNGQQMEPGHLMTWRAQMAVGDPRQHPELAGKVATVDTRDFWRSRGESPTNTGYHYNHNAETFVLTGDAVGRAMVRLLGGNAEPLSIPARQKQHADVEAIYSDAVTSTFNKRGPHYPPEYYREMGQALRPILMDEIVPEFLGTVFETKRRSLLQNIATGTPPEKRPTDLRSELDTLMDYYNMAGVPGLHWKSFGPELGHSEWSYFSFDPPEQQAAEQSDRYRPITFPTGLKNWYATDFDPVAAGWKSGKTPFGTMGGKLDRRRPRCNGARCGCSEMPATLWEHEVLLMRKTIKVPPLKPGHVYRIILGGAGCDRSGEGFAIYANGKPLTQVDGGFYRYTGVRGGYIFDDTLPEFQSGTVTIAVINFLRYTHFRNKTTYFGPHPDYYAQPVPPNGHVSLWLEEAKLSPALLEAVK